uniref:Major capsid protein n=1 Tax=Dulem virus 144 TaxID=3145621 RepID=A0AAU8AZJ6_9VIRU
MSRNQQSRFALNPTNLDMSRSKFPRHSSVKFSFNVGDVVPFYVDEVLPGDTFSVKTSKVVRMQSLLTPLMDNIYLDYYFFFVPNRIVWEHWRELNGENRESAWAQTTEYEVPQVTAPTGGWNIGTIADYMGIPTGVSNISVNAMPFRAYAMICDEWFRDENLVDPLFISKGDAVTTGVNTRTNPGDYAAGGQPFIAAKFHDYFTSALPSPQKGPDVGIGLTGSFDVTGNGNPIRFSVLTSDGSSVPVGTVGAAADFSDRRSSGAQNTLGIGFNNTDAVGTLGFPTTAQFTGDVLPFMEVNLGGVNAVTINALRMAFQMQKLYEKDARGGTRYVEILKAHFGVTSPDSRLQRPEYLGGSRVPININQVVQTSETGSGTPQGNTAAYSVTTDSHKDFTKSFVEHGFVIGVCVARYTHSYQQGIERFWSRKSRFDYYWPVFANIGEQAILNKEIYAQGSATDDEVFGYQEAWADYRYKPSRVAGEMRSSAAQSLDVWHLADEYIALPSLSAGWIQENKTTVDRVLAVSEQNANQLFCDIYVENYTTRPMPVYSIPGLVDHH